MTPLLRRPCLALPFTVLTAPDTVRLIAGEDFRYTLTAPGLDTWLPAWLEQLDGRQTLEHVLAILPEQHRSTASQLVERLHGERVMIDGPPAAAIPPVAGIAPEGSASWREQLPATRSGTLVLCQDRLDFDEALRFNRARLAGNSPWLWATTGPMERAYVSPLFLPDAGPCLGCLLEHFHRVSPAPELYDVLLAHARAGRPVAPSPFPPHALAVLVQLILWKASLANAAEPPAVLFRLHVLEASVLEVSTHRVFIDPECPECRGRS